MINSSHNKAIPIIKKMWNEGFGDSYDFISTYISRYMNEENYCLKIDDISHQPIGMAHCPQFSNNVGMVGYLYAVLVAPHFRNKGEATKIITHTFQQMWNRGDTICATIPATESLRYWYSERFGFTKALNNAIIKFDLASDFDFGGDDVNEDIGFFRIINALEYLKQYCKVHDNIKLHIFYSDPILPQNSGEYNINNSDVNFTPALNCSGLTPQQLYTNFRLETHTLNNIGSK